MIQNTCPFCTKTGLKGYPFTLDSQDEEQAKEPYDTNLNRVCRKCQKCPEMQKALDRNAYDNLKQFILSYVNGNGDFKSLKIDFRGKKAVITTSPKYKQTQIEPPYTIGEEETKQLKARLYNQHIELWADFYTKGEQREKYTWWELSMLFDGDRKTVKRGIDKISPMWNRLIKVIGRYFEWLYKDWCDGKMYAMKYNHKTGEWEVPTNTMPPFTDYWNMGLKIPEIAYIPTIDEIKPSTRVCVYARSNQIGGGNATKKQIKEIQAVCMERKLKIVAKYEDEGVSGIQEMGDGLKALFQGAEQKEFTHVILTNVSRYSRNTLKAWEIWKALQDKGIQTVVIPPKKWGYWLNY